MAAQALSANTYLEGTYSEVYPSISQDEEGMKEAVQAVLVPRRDPEPRRAQTPGSIHEGGELGYALCHAFGAAFDNPDLIVATALSATVKLGNRAARHKLASQQVPDP